MWNGHSVLDSGDRRRIHIKVNMNWLVVDLARPSLINLCAHCNSTLQTREEV